MPPDTRGLDSYPEPMRPFVYEAPAVIRGMVYPDCSFGAHSYINEGQIRECTDIGRFCSIAHGVKLGVSDHFIHLASTASFAASSEFHDAWHVSPYKPPKARDWNARTHIGHDVWIGANVIVRAGVRLGVGAVVGAGAVVTSDVPPYGVVAGIPAKLLKYRFPLDVRLALLASEWWDYPLDLLKRLPANNIALFLEKLAASQSPRAHYDWVRF